MTESGPSSPKLHRFHAEDLSTEQVALSAGEAHHALRVLRLARGTEVEVFDGRGGAALGRLVLAGHGAAAVQIERRLPRAARPGRSVHLAFAIPKGKRLDWLLEKAAELGAASLRPVLFARSIAGRQALGKEHRADSSDPGAPGSAVRRDRWLGHCIAAAKQSGQVFVPEIAAPLALPDFLAWVAGLGAGGAPGPRRAGVRLVGLLRPEAVSLPKALAEPFDKNAAQTVHLLVGPEGGLTDDEAAAATRAGFVAVRLGHTTLRVETAAVALLAAALAVLED